MNCTLCDVPRQKSATTRSCYYFHVPDSQRGRKVQISIDQLGMIHGIPAALSKQYFSCTVGCRTGLKKDGVGKQIFARYLNIWFVNSNLAKLGCSVRAEASMLMAGPAEA